MDVYVSITIGSLAVDARVENCGPDALGDAMRQSLSAARELVGADAIKAAVAESPESSDDEGD